MPTFEIELTDGRRFQFEADEEPTERDILAAIEAPEAAPEVPRQTFEQALPPWMQPQPPRPSLEPVSIQGPPLPRFVPETITAGPPTEREALTEELRETIGAPATATLPQMIQAAPVEFGEVFGPMVEREITRPFVSIPRPSPEFAEKYLIGGKYGTAAPTPEERRARAEWTAALAEVPIGLTEFVESPLGVETTAAGMFGPIAGAGIAGAYGIPMALEVPEVAREAGRISVEGTPFEQKQALVGLGTQIGLPATMAVPLARPALRGVETLRERRQRAREIQKAAEVYGDVRTQPFPGEGEVPAEIRGERVQPQAARVAEEAQVLLTPEEEAYRRAEREGMAEPKQPEIVSGADLLAPEERAELEGMFITARELGLGQRVRIVERIPGDLQHNVVAAADPVTGNTLVDPVALRNRMARKGGTREERMLAVGTEEGIHHQVIAMMRERGENTALNYWNSLTALEQGAIRRTYLQKAAEPDLSNILNLMTPTKWGHEALRMRLQRMMDLTPTEIGELAGVERWTARSVEFLTDLIRRIREIIGTKAGREGQRIANQVFERIGKNANEARKAVGLESDPTIEAPFMPSREPKTPEEMAREAANAIGNVRFDAVFYQAGKPIAANFTLLDKSGKQSTSITVRGEPTIENVREKVNAAKARYVAAGDTSLGYPEEAPMMPARGKREPERELFLPEAERGIERPTALALGAMPITPRNIEAEAIRHLTEQAAPDFKAFTDEARSRFGDIQPGQLRDTWINSVWNRLMTASGSELQNMARAMGLTKRLKMEATGGGFKQIADALPEVPTFKLQGEEVSPEVSRAARETVKAQTESQKYRNRVIAVLGERLIKQADEGRKRFHREEVTPEEVAQPTTTQKQASYNEISSAERQDVQTLGATLTDDWRAFGGAKITKTIGDKTVEIKQKGLPVSVTHRVTVLQNRETGKVAMVSTYRDGRRGPVLIDPDAPGKTHGKLESVMKRYRPIASIRLDEPVQNFIQRFDSLADYEASFGQPARRMTERWSGYEAPAEEGVEIPARLELRQPISPEEARSIIDYIEGEVGVFDSPLDVMDAINALRQNPAGDTLSALAKLAWNLDRKTQFKLTGEEIVSELANQLYADHKSSATSSEFVEKTVARGPARRVATAEARAQAALEAAETAREEIPPTAKELTMPIERVPPTVVRGEPLPKGPGPEPKLPEPKAPELLTPEEQVLLRQQLAREFPPRYSSTLYRQLAQRQVPKRPYTMGPSEALEPTEEAPMMPLRDWKKQPSKIVEDAVLEPLRLYSQWMVDRIRQFGGERSNQAADIFNKIIDDEKRLYGRLTQLLDPARKEAGKLGLFDFVSNAIRGRPAGLASKWFHGLRPVTRDTAVMNSVDAIENRIPVPAYAERLKSLAQLANLAVGRLYESVSPGFEAGGKFQRNLTAFGYDILRQGKGDVWQAWAEGIARANNVPVEQVTDFFINWKEVLDDPKFGLEIIEKVNQDFRRVFPRAITHVRTLTGWQPVMHADLYNYLESTARRATHIAAFRRQFPNTPEGRKLFTKLRDEVYKELPGGLQKEWEGLIRTLQGHPTDNYTNLPTFMQPGRAPAEVFRFANQTLGNLFAKMVLTGQMWVQPMEFFTGGATQFLGAANWLRGLARLKELWAELERTGSVNPVIYDWSIDPTAKVRTAFRIGGNALSRYFGEQLINELQERHAAAMARVVRERVQAGTLSNWERRNLPATFRNMGFTPEQAARMMRGDQALLAQFERKAAAWLTSGNRAIAEGSRLGANRLLNSLFRFQHYPMMKMNQWRQVQGDFNAAWSRAGTAAQRLSATERLARFFFGNTIQGLGTVMLATWASEMLFGTQIKAKELADEPIRFLTEAYLSAMSGPLYLVWRGARYKGVAGVGEQATRMVFPYAIFREMLDMAHGFGPYQDLNTWDRAAEFIKNKTPATRPMKHAAAMFGLSVINPDLETAIRAYYRWSKREFGFEERRNWLKERERRQFREYMRKAVDALVKGDEDAYDDYRRAAVEAQEDASSKNVAASLRGRKILTTPRNKPLTEEQLGALAKRIGPKAVQMLQDYDAMLEAAADKL